MTRLVKQLKLEVMVQRGAGLRAGFRDEMYERAGATLAADAASTVSGSPIVAKVQPPSAEEIAQLDEGATLISLLRPG
ncbi:MAG: Re/Si-specific NAD(P)(+) transhydrogenase subunit alpha, partial [Gemmatimonadaceae bacterium]